MAVTGIGEFLRTRRGRLTPQDVGLRPAPGIRRVPGLRREELAQLAGLSVDYYVQLEQGRRPHVSPSVLDAVARALRLTTIERAHLDDLVSIGRQSRSTRSSPGAPHPVAEKLQTLLDLIDRVPALILGRRMDFMAWNSTADAVFAISDRHPRDRNVAREIFLHTNAHALYPDWEVLAEEAAAYLRLDAGRHPTDARLASLVGELSITSETFRALWARHDIREKNRGHTRIRHPVVGELEFDYQALSFPTVPDQLLVTYAFTPGSPTEDRLNVLMSWNAPVDRDCP